MKTYTREPIRCRAHRGTVWRQRCALDAVHVLDGGRAYWAGDKIWWEIAESERMTEPERQYYDWFIGMPGGDEHHDSALEIIALQRDTARMRRRAVDMALFTSLALLAFLLFVYFWGHA